MIDNRQIVKPSDPLFNTFPFTTVTAVDVRARLSNGVFDHNAGTGITIAPKHLLTAGHVGAYRGSNNNVFRATINAN